MDVQGRFTASGLEPGEYRLRYQSDASEAGGFADVVAPAANVRLVLPRETRAPVTVSIRWPDVFVPDVENDRWWVASVEAPRAVDWGEDPTETSGPLRRYDLFPGAYAVSVRCGGCIVLRHRFEVPSTGKVDLGVLEPKLLPAVDGQVVYADGGAVPYARLNLREFAYTKADALGRFHLDHGPGVPLTAVVGADDVPATVVDLPLPTLGKPWRIVVGQGGLLQGHVPGVTGDVHIRVEALDRRGHAPAEAPGLDTAARFLVRLAPGEYRVSVLHEKEVLVTADASITEGETSAVTLRLP